jgi:hypothetical protein
MIAPPSPLAVPARCGRTDSIPAVALGMRQPVADADEGAEAEEDDRRCRTQPP